MWSLSKIKYYLFFYRYNILFPSVVGGIIFLDWSNLRKKRKLAVEQALKKAAKG